MKFSQVPILSALGLSFVIASPINRRQYDQPMFYEFEQIEATVDLNWRPCFDDFICTKLLVPLDYEDEAAGTTHVSFIKWASNSTRTNGTAQDILINPGGPGGSGIAALVGGLAMFLQSLGTDNNLVGFDPRGVSNSGPNLSCFPNGELGTSRFYHDIDGPIEYSDAKSYARAFERAAAFGDFCTNAHSAPNDTAKYANTVATVNDMRHYTELLADSIGQDPEKSQLWYYGLSYGTVLGTTFASLFPSRVLSLLLLPWNLLTFCSRIAVDGVVDAEDYYQGKWIVNVADSDESFRYFFQACYAAGEGGNCSFWVDSPAAIEARFEAIVRDLEIRPIPVTIDTPAIVTASDLKAFAFQITYFPIGSYPDFADLLVELERRNGTRLANNLGIGRRVYDDCEAAIPGTYQDVEPRQFIACTDANDRYNLSTFDAWVQHADTLVNMSRYFGEAWAPATSINCRKLDIKAPTSQVFEGYPSASKTSNPLFFLSTIIDPVTPLRSAEKMTKRFGGASLLIQNSVGHTTTASVSECTSGYLRDYFDDGSLPEYGAHCEADRFPFGIREQLSRG